MPYAKRLRTCTKFWAFKILSVEKFLFILRRCKTVDLFALCDEWLYICKAVFKCSGRNRRVLVKHIVDCIFKSEVCKILRKAHTGDAFEVLWKIRRRKIYNRWNLVKRNFTLVVFINICNCCFCIWKISARNNRILVALLKQVQFFKSR